MYAKDLIKGSIIYCIPIFIQNYRYGFDKETGEEINVGPFEIYEVSSLYNKHNGVTHFILNSIIGEGAVLRLPSDINISELVPCCYSLDSIWGFTINEELAVKCYTMYLEGKLEYDVCYAVWDEKWRTLKSHDI